MAKHTLNPGPVVGCAVDKGAQRSCNQDSAATIHLECNSQDGPRAVDVFAIADGMGGKTAGDVASKVAIQTATRALMNRLTKTEAPVSDAARRSYPQWLQDAVHRANDTVYATNPRMGTTLVLALVAGDRAYLANVGDSRAYLVTAEGITQITQDHSVVQELIRARVIASEQASRHPLRNLLTQSIGTDGQVAADVFTVNIPVGGYLLMCTDGLTNELDNATIQQIICRAKSPQAACDALVAAANRSGGHDNIAIILAQITEHALPWQRRSNAPCQEISSVMNKLPTTPKPGIPAANESFRTSTPSAN